jgi:hypothetical protein
LANRVGQRGIHGGVLQVEIHSQCRAGEPTGACFMRQDFPYDLKESCSKG